MSLCGKRESAVDGALGELAEQQRRRSVFKNLEEKPEGERHSFTSKALNHLHHIGRSVLFCLCLHRHVRHWRLVFQVEFRALHAKAASDHSSELDLS